MNIQIVDHNKTPSESVARLNEVLGVQPTVQLHYGKAVDKIAQYEFFKAQGLPHPEWSINWQDAEKWLENGHTVVCREKVKSAKGDGVFLVTPGNDLVDAQVYCKYQKKKREFRVNLFKHKVVNIREKKRKAGAEGNTNIWSPNNGYFTTHVQQTIPSVEVLKELAEKASIVSESDFNGVDIIYNQTLNKFFVLEVNSGPAIEGSSVDEFAAAIKASV